MDYDKILNSLGDFGSYQRCIYCLLCLPAFLCGIHSFSGVFLLAQPHFRCALPQELNASAVNYSLPAVIWQKSYPQDAANFQSCEYFIRPNETSSECERYVYDESVFQNSAVTEWNLVCARDWLVATNQALLMLGLLLGSIIFGQLADRCGRQKILTAALLLQVFFGVLVAFAPDYISFSVGRILLGSTITGIFPTAYVLAMEMVGPRRRLFASVGLMVSYASGVVSLSLFAYFVRDWRHLQLALTLPGLLFLPYKLVIPESTRWLLLHQQNERAKANIQQLARRNCVSIPHELLSALNEVPDMQTPTAITTWPQPSLLDMLKLPNMRRKSAQIFFNWFVIAATYYGLSWHTHLLGENVLLNFAISSIVEIPAHSVMLLVLNRFGRRIVLCVNLLISGTGLLLTAVVPHDVGWLTVGFAMIGKFGVTAAFGTVYMFSAEQFPTAVRNVGLGFASMTARIGGILTPYIFLLTNVWHPLPLLICGTLATLAGVQTLLLPETLNKPTLETLADGEKFRRRKRGKGSEDDRELQNLNAY